MSVKTPHRTRCPVFNLTQDAAADSECQITGRARLTAVSGRKQHAVLSFLQHVVEMQQRGRLQDDGGTENACRVHEQGAQTGDDTLCGAQVGSTLATAIEDA